MEKRAASIACAINWPTRRPFSDGASRPEAYRETSPTSPLVALDRAVGTPGARGRATPGGADAEYCADRERDCPRVLDQAQIAGLKASLEIPAKDYLKAMRIRRLLQDAIRLMWGDLDALLAPARTGVAPKIDAPLSPPPGAASSATRFAQPHATPAGFDAIIPAGNLAGLPALVLPCGFAGNLPLAVQLVGPPWSENTLLAIGKEFQSRTDWHKRRPPAV